MTPHRRMTPSARDGRTSPDAPVEGEGGYPFDPTYDERMRGTILLVEDDYSMGTLVQDYLLHDEYRVVWVRNGAEALAEARRRPFSLVLLDIGLPDIDGFDVCRRLKTFCDVPIIMLTARGDEADRVAGLEIGADDYVPKPFSPRELMARVKAVLRRAGAADEIDTLHAGDVDVDLRAREVTVAGAPVQLTQKEFDLLVQLLSHPGVVYSRDELLERAWRLDYPGGTRTVDVHVAQLRRKLGRADIIETVHGVGYKTPRP
jgi:DNA-binding response OmpR family regulator